MTVDNDTNSESPEFSSIDIDKIIEDKNSINDVVEDFVGSFDESNPNFLPQQQQQEEEEQQQQENEQVKKLNEELEEKHKAQDTEIAVAKNKLQGDNSHLTEEYLKEVIRDFLLHFKKIKIKRHKLTKTEIEVPYVFYQQKIAEMFEKNNPLLIINFKDILEYRNQIIDKEAISKLIYKMKHSPYKVREWFTEEVGRLFHEESKNYEDEEGRLPEFVRMIQVGFNNFDDKVTQLNEFRTQILSKFVTTEGVISQFDDMPRVKILESVWTCNHCNHIYFQKGNKPPSKCTTKDCTSRQFEQDLSQQKGEDYLDIRLTQQYSGGMQMNNTTVDRYCRITGTALVNHILKNVSPGQIAVVNGVVTLSETLKKKDVDDDTSDIEIDAFYVEQKNNINIFDYDERLMNTVKDHIGPHNIKAHVSKLINSICSHVYGHMPIKEAVLLQLVGTNPRKRQNGTRVKGDINILVAGPSGTAKSDFGEAEMAIIPHSMKAGTPGQTTVAGLTTYVDTNAKTGKKTNSLGVLALCDMKGIVICEEINRRPKRDLAEFATATDDNQQILVNKGGFHSIIHSRCPVYATANSLDNNGIWNRAETVSNQTKLDSFILQRMDLVFVSHIDQTKEYKEKLMAHIEASHGNAMLEKEYKAKVEQKNQVQYTESVLKQVEISLRNNDFTGEYPVEYMRHEIFYLKTIDCKLLPGTEAYKILTDFWIQSSSNKAITQMTLEAGEPVHHTLETESLEIRKFNTLCKIAETYGRLYRQTVVQPEHSRMACDMVSLSIASTIPQISDDINEAQNEFARKMMDRNTAKALANSMTAEKQQIKNRVFLTFSKELRRFNDILYKTGWEICKQCRGMGETSEMVDSETKKFEIYQCLSCEGRGGNDKPFTKNDLESIILNMGAMSEKKFNSYWNMYKSKKFFVETDSYGRFKLKINLQAPEVTDAITAIATNITEAYMERLENDEQVLATNRKIMGGGVPKPKPASYNDDPYEQ